MLRRFVTFVPLVLLLGVIALWIVSSYRYISVAYGTRQRVIELAFSHGRFRLLHKGMPDPRVNPWRSKFGPPMDWSPGLSAATEDLDGDYCWDRPLMSVGGSFDWRQMRLAGIWLCRGSLSQDNARGDTEDAFIYPFWFFESPMAWPASLLAVGGAITVLAWRRRRRRVRDGLCAACSYDLRAHKAGERCPECGTTVAGGGFRYKGPDSKER